VERERALAAEEAPLSERLRLDARLGRRRRWRLLRAFVFGLIMGCIAVFATLWYVASRLPH
jgi:hypothetical protein